MSPQQTEGSSPLEQLKQAAALFQQGQWRESAAMCRALLSNGHALFDVFHLYGLSLFQLRQLDQAEEYLRHAVERQPDNAQARNSFGSVFFAQEHFEEAEREFTQAISLNPKYWDPYQNLANVYLNQQKFNEAESLLESAQQQLGNQLPILRLRAKLFRRTHQYQKSLEVLDQIIEQNQEDFSAINDKGITFNLLGQYDLSLSYFENIIKCAPDFVAAYINLGYAHYKLGQYQDAKRIFSKAIDLLENRDNHLVTQQLQNNNEDRDTLIAKINFLLSSIALVRGNYHSGWRYYTNRPSNLLHHKLVSQKLPADLSGKRILLQHDQGFGDEIFFLRFCKPLKQRNAYIHYIATPMTRSLFQGNEYIDNISSEVPDEKFDYKLTVGDLPYTLDIDDAEKIPEPIVITPKTQKRERYAELLSNLPRPLIGLTWRAGTANSYSAYGVEHPDKRIPLKTLAELFNGFKGTLVVLQRNPQPEELTELSEAVTCNVVDLSQINDDLSDATAAISFLDDYIGVSNTNTHICGSLGQTAKVLIPFPPEWRWLDAGSTSPWYPGFTIYRQSEDGDWSAAMGQIKNDMAKQ